MTIETEWFLKTYPNITTIEAIMPDCNGIMRGKWVPVEKLGKLFSGDAKLPKSALNLDVWGRDVEELVFESGDEDGLCGSNIKLPSSGISVFAMVWQSPPYLSIRPALQGVDGG